ncbi:MAG TPA: type II secretion system F family protein [Acidimicrobiales bacterium]|nr:type II secretion system F family protein [Acidimicrobiales bacterium]
MEKYRYSAFDQTGNKISGVEAANSAGAAHLALLERGYQTVEVSEKKKSILQFEVTKKLVPRKDLMHFSRQLAVFVRAGVPIMEALEIIAGETSDKLLKKCLGDMIERLQSGDTFASAAAAHPETFPSFYLGILSSAELTGNLDGVLDQLADYLDRDIEARGKVTSALIYPAVVAVMAVVVVIILATFVMPKFVVFFKSFNAKLPLPTRLLLSSSNFVGHYWWALVGVIVAIFIGVIAMRRSRSGKARIDAVILHLPLLGDLVRTSIIERICRILSSMLKAGVSLPDAMRVTAESANNAVYSRGLATVREEMIEGQGLAEPLARTELFPGAARQMFRVGEETGTLDAQLATAAAFYDRELDVKLKRFTSLFEPIVIVFMGVIVGFVAIALVSAMYGIYKQVKVQ